jgi:hypothetical protein
MPGLTPRAVLQQWGTEVLRNGFHDDIWIASIENKFRTNRTDIVISDCRFPNEIKLIKNAGGKVIWVRRGPLPIWYNTALHANINCSALAIAELQQLGIHSSETAWVGAEFDAIVDNDGSISDLYNTVKSLVQ